MQGKRLIGVLGWSRQGDRKGKTTVAEVARRHDLTPSEVEGWIDEATRHLENGFRSRPKEVREQYEAELKEAREALGEAQLQIRALKKLEHWSDRTRPREGRPGGAGQ